MLSALLLFLLLPVPSLLMRHELPVILIIQTVRGLVSFIMIVIIMSIWALGFLQLWQSIDISGSSIMASVIPMTSVLRCLLVMDLGGLVIVHSELIGPFLIEPLLRHGSSHIGSTFILLVGVALQGLEVFIFIDFNGMKSFIVSFR